MSSTTSVPVQKRFAWAVVIGVSVLAAGLLVVHLIWPDRVDAIALALLVLMALPGLGLVLQSAQLPGGVNIQFRDLEQRMARTEESAEVAMGAVKEHAALTRQYGAVDVPSRTAPFPAAPPSVPAVAAEQPAPEAADGPPAPTPPDAPLPPPVPAKSGPSPNGDRGHSAPTVESLADEYLQLRKTLSSGPARTRLQTDIVGRMVTRTAVDMGFDPIAALTSAHGGQRLAGYAYAYSQHDPSLAPLLFQSTIADDLPFNQYWGLTALRVTLETTGTTLTSDQIRKLLALRGQVTDDASRVRQIDAILAFARSASATP